MGTYQRISSKNWFEDPNNIEGQLSSEENIHSSSVGPTVPLLNMFARKVTTLGSSESLVDQRKLLGANLMRTGHLYA